MKKNIITIIIAISMFVLGAVCTISNTNKVLEEHEEFVESIMVPEEREIEELAEKITLISSDDEGFVLNIDGELHNYTYEEPEEECSLIESIMLVEEYDNSYVLEIGGELYLYHF